MEAYLGTIGKGCFNSTLSFYSKIMEQDDIFITGIKNMLEGVVKIREQFPFVNLFTLTLLKKISNQENEYIRLFIEGLKHLGINIIGISNPKYLPVWLTYCDHKILTGKSVDYDGYYLNYPVQEFFVENTVKQGILKLSTINNSIYYVGDDLEKDLKRLSKLPSQKYGFIFKNADAVTKLLIPQGEN